MNTYVATAGLPSSRRNQSGLSGGKGGSHIAAAAAAAQDEVIAARRGGGDWRTPEQRAQDKINFQTWLNAD